MKYSAFTVIFLLSVSFLISLSIGGIIAITISFIASYYLFGNKVVSKKIFYGTSAFFAIFALSVFLFFSVTKGIESIDFDKNPVTHSLHRLIFWQRAYSLFLDNPLLGTGPDTFGLVKINDQTPPYSSNAHNFFIQTLSDTGIFGFFTFTILIGSIFIKAYNIIRSNISDKKRLFYISLYVGLFASTLFAAMDFDWYLPTVFTIFWIFASLLTNYAK